MVIAAVLLLATFVITVGCTANQQVETKQGDSILGTIEGTVNDANVKPVPGMRVSIVSGTTGFPEILALTDEKGHYAISSVPAGRFEVAVHDMEGKKVGSGNITVRGGETSTLNITVPAAINGEEVLPDMTPAEGWLADGVFSYREYSAEMMAAGGNFEIRWRADEKYIYIGIKAKTSGWVSIGFDPTVRMKDADMLFGCVQNGITFISDEFSTGDYGPHSPDIELGGTDNIIEFGGKEEDGFTIIEFKRALDTGDQYDNAIAEGSTTIIWAYGSDDDITTMHSARGDGEISI